MIDGSRLVFQREISGGTGDFRRGNVLPEMVLGEQIPDNFPVLLGLMMVKFRDLREPELTDYIRQLILPVTAAGQGREHKHSSFVCFLYYNGFRGK